MKTNLNHEGTSFKVTPASVPIKTAARPRKGLEGRRGKKSKERTREALPPKLTTRKNLKRRFPGRKRMENDVRKGLGQANICPDQEAKRDGPRVQAE